MHTVREIRAQVPITPFAGFCLIALVASAIAGCLSFGGETTYLQSSPETDARVQELEQRVATLEQALNPSPQ